MSGLALHPNFDTRAPASAPACGRQGILARISAAIARSLERRAEQEAARFIAEHGKRLTDDIERQLTEHFNGGGFLRHLPPRPFRPFPGA